MTDEVIVKGSWPLVWLDATGRPLWHVAGTNPPQYEADPKLEAIYMEAQQRIKPVIRYPGAKWNLAEWIVSLMPAHKHYLEPFFGSGAVFFSKPPAEHEIINDLSGDIVNLFRIIRTRGLELAAAIEMTPWARDEYELSYEPSTDDLERARRFIVKAHQGGPPAAYRHTGWRHVYAINMYRYPSRQWLDTPDDILSIISRLRGVEIENKPALDLIPRYSNPDTLIYADPPYMPETRTGGRMYGHEMTLEQHIALLNALDAHHGPAILSGYHSELYDTRLSHWRVYEQSTIAEKGGTRTEALWLNQVCVDRLGYGPLFAQEAA